MKRTSLADLAPRKATAAPAAVAEATPAPAALAEALAPARAAAGKAPPPYKSVLSKIDEATHKQLKRLAIDEGVPVGDLQVEALNLLFRSRGLPEIAVRVTPDESGRRN